MRIEGRADFVERALGGLNQIVGEFGIAGINLQARELGAQTGSQAFETAADGTGRGIELAYYIIRRQIAIDAQSHWDTSLGQRVRCPDLEHKQSLSESLLYIFQEFRWLFFSICPSSKSKKLPGIASIPKPAISHGRAT
jgi:hypothetical protein